jgi:probable F420-dependent oxidoreductase
VTRPFTLLAAVQGVHTAAELGDLARRAESIGYDALVVPDHLIAQLSPVPAMATIAAATTRLRLASLDILSEGRLDVAIGAGWRQVEYEAIGLAFDRPPVRAARLAEAVAVLKGCFADGPFSFAGEHYTITDFDGQPKPVQRPHPPLFIGAGGRRVLSLAAREADVVGFAPRAMGPERTDPHSITWAATEEKIGWVREAAGDRFDDLTLNVYPSGWPVTITDDPRAAAREIIEHLRGRTGIELTEDEVLTSPHLFIGSVDGIADKCRALREGLGITSIMLGEVDEMAPVVERLAGT